MVTINGKTVGVDIFIDEDIDEFNNEQSLDYKIAVMQWFRDGGKVEFWDEFSEGWEKIRALAPVWDWSEVDYRAVPKAKEPEYRPYTFEDFCTMGMIGKVVKNKDDNQIGFVKTYSDNPPQILIQYEDYMAWYTFDKLPNICTWLDGSPCGVLINGN